MKKPTATQEKVIIKPRPPKDATFAPTQECPVVVTPADTTAAPTVNPTEEMADGPVVAEEE